MPQKQLSDQRFCECCKRPTLHVKTTDTQSDALGCLGLLAIVVAAIWLFASGMTEAGGAAAVLAVLWLIAWVLSSLSYRWKNRRSPFRCQQCGQAN